MIYRSNLTAPDLQPFFKHVHCRVMPHSMGHDVLSDWTDKADDDPVFGIFKRCGLWTHDEAAILYNVAKRAVFGRWLDIGSHTGWTTLHIDAGCGLNPVGVDPMYSVPEFHARIRENLKGCDCPLFAGTSDQYFSLLSSDIHYAGVCIDGDHCSPHPLRDAQNAAKHLAKNGVIIFHDAMGAPVIEGVNWLLDNGFKCRYYYTPHLIALCWRGDFTPPDHTRDPRIDWRGIERLMPTFEFARCA